VIRHDIMQNPEDMLTSILVALENVVAGIELAPSPQLFPARGESK
jgi:hypothetical protein